MIMPFAEFDRSKLRVLPLGEREHDMTIDEMLELDAAVEEVEDKDLDELAERIVTARKAGGTVIWSMGAHVIKRGLSRFVADFIRQGIVTHLVGNGACTIHDYEMSLIGATTESVAKYIQTGQFGLWQETGNLNEAAKAACRDGIGLGEAVGRMIVEEACPYREQSIYAAAYETKIPATVHLGIGYDINHELPNCDGAALGEASYRDFLILAETITGLEGGVFMNFGSAVMGPEVYLKALSMARNVCYQEGRDLRHFTSANFDLFVLGEYTDESPKDNPMYYYRPWKTILVRTVADGGESFYFRLDHGVSIPNLHRRVMALWS
jgi:hypothetical protein